MTDIAASRERDEEWEAASTLTVAGELVGCALVDPVSLGGPDRSLVLRCGTTSPTGPSTVVVKRYPDTAGGAASYARETAGLAEISLRQLSSAPTMPTASWSWRTSATGRPSRTCSSATTWQRPGTAHWAGPQPWGTPWGGAIPARPTSGRCSVGRESRTGTRFSPPARASTGCGALCRHRARRPSPVAEREHGQRPTAPLRRTSPPCGFSRLVTVTVVRGAHRLTSSPLVAPAPTTRS